MCAKITLYFTIRRTSAQFTDTLQIVNACTWYSYSSTQRYPATLICLLCNPHKALSLISIFPPYGLPNSTDVHYYQAHQGYLKLISKFPQSELFITISMWTCCMDSNTTRFADLFWGQARWPSGSLLVFTVNANEGHAELLWATVPTYLSPQIYV
jgi:hypothetical protein